MNDDVALLTTTKSTPDAQIFLVGGADTATLIQSISLAQNLGTHAALRGVSSSHQASIFRTRLNWPCKYSGAYAMRELIICDASTRKSLIGQPKNGLAFLHNSTNLNIA